MPGFYIAVITSNKTYLVTKISFSCYSLKRLLKVSFMPIKLRHQAVVEEDHQRERVARKVFKKGLEEKSQLFHCQVMMFTMIA